MKTIIHSIKPTLQPTNHSCGQTAVAMLLGHYGVNKTPTEIIEWIKYIDADGNEIGSMTAQLAAKIIDLGFDVDFFTFDYLLVNRDWKNLSADDLIKKMNIVRQTRKVQSPISGYESQYLDAYIELIEKGGKLHIENYPTAELLLKLIKDGPIFANVVQDVLTGHGWEKETGLRQTKPDDDGRIVTHSVIIYGFENGKFLIADPWSGDLSAESEQLLVAITMAQIECDNMIFQIKRNNQITHEQQRQRWEEEHTNPKALKQMNLQQASSGVVKFVDFLKREAKNFTDLSGVEMCCGKGRNVIELARNGVDMTGLDFSEFAIKEAKRRAAESGAGKAKFLVQDVILTWPIAEDSQDFVIDCFGSTDIENAAGRQAALDNIIRVLKPGGYLLVYVMTTDDALYKEMRKVSPGPDEGSFLNLVNKKYEKVFSEAEVKNFYKSLNLLQYESMRKEDVFLGKKYIKSHIWAVFQKPKGK